MSQHVGHRRSDEVRSAREAERADVVALIERNIPHHDPNSTTGSILRTLAGLIRRGEHVRKGDDNG